MIKHNASTNHRVMYRAMRIALLLSIIIFAFVIISHDYPGSDHFDFLYNLLRDDASIKQIQHLFALNGIAQSNLVQSATIKKLIMNVSHLVQHNLDYEDYWTSLAVFPGNVNIVQDSLCYPVPSDLSPPADIVDWARELFPLSSCVVLSSDGIIQKNWFNHIALNFRVSVASRYVKIGNIGRDSPFFHSLNWSLVGFNNALKCKSCVDIHKGAEEICFAERLQDLA